MAAPDDAIVQWAVAAAAPGARVSQVVGLRSGGSPWLIELTDSSVGDVVLRLGEPADLDLFVTEVAGLQAAAVAQIPAPRLLAADLDGQVVPDLLAVLTTRIEGTSRVDREPSTDRLRALGQALARVHRATVPSSAALPLRHHSIDGVDFDALRRDAPTRPLLVRAERCLASTPRPPSPHVFVHGDYWQGNTMWNGDQLTGIIDWDCAGVGPAGIDIGSMRCDAAMSKGLAAADDALAGYQSATGRAADDVAYWDVVAALSTPPTIDWFVGAIQGQGRVDLDQQILLDRRDAFLESALARLA